MLEKSQVIPLGHLFVLAGYNSEELDSGPNSTNHFRVAFPSR